FSQVVPEGRNIFSAYRSRYATGTRISISDSLASQRPNSEPPLRCPRPILFGAMAIDSPGPFLLNRKKGLSYSVASSSGVLVEMDSPFRFNYHLIPFAFSKALARLISPQIKNRCAPNGPRGVSIE